MDKETSGTKLSHQQEIWREQGITTEEEVEKEGEEEREEEEKDKLIPTIVSASRGNKYRAFQNYLLFIIDTEGTGIVIG